MKPGNLTLAAVALLSAALIAYQVAIIQFLSLVQWYHYASMVISIALLGFGAAGSLLSIKREWILLHSDKLQPILIAGCALTMIASAELTRSGIAGFDSYLLFTGDWQWLRLLISYLLFFIPFFLGALALGIVFTKYVATIGKIYFSNLAGSAAGALLAAFLAWYFLPVSLPLAPALLAIIGALLLVKRKNRWLIIVLCFPIAVVILFRLTRPPVTQLSDYKSLSKTMNLPGAKILLQRPGPYGLVQVVSADALRYAPGLSLAFDKEVPAKKVIFNNGDWFGPIDSWNTTDSFHLLDYTTMSLPYVLKKRNKVLVLNAGTGINISHALRHNVSNIDAVEPHQTVAKLLLHELTGDNDSLFHRPQVKFHITEPRSFLSAANKKYDLVQLPLIGAFGGGVGLYAMREEYGLTKEAFSLMWDLLEDDGVICITTWMDYPFRNSLKVTATLAELLDDTARYRSHLLAVRSWATVTYLLKKSAITADDVSAVRKFCNEYFFDPLLLPGLQQVERMTHNGISDTSFFIYTGELLGDNRKKLYAEYGFHIEPATDDKPYFSQFLRRKSLPQLSGLFGSQNVSFIELGWLISVLTFLQLLLLTVLLIIVPLFKLRRVGSGGKKSWTMLYFSGLGIGYMFFEIVLIQKFILFFGNPVYASAIVICVMLLASGIGSLYSSRFLIIPSIMQRLLLTIFLCLSMYTVGLTWLLQQIGSVPDLFKLILAIVIIAVPAFLMGMPFPLGLRAQLIVAEENIPWAWGINGCMSVISAALAILLTVETGFSTVIMLAAICYAISMVSIYLVKKKLQGSPFIP
jgi:spermidine synthase